MKKQTQIAKVIDLLKTNSNISAQDMAQKLAMPLSRVYVLRNQAKKRMGRNAFDQVVDVKQTHIDKRYVANLEAENKKLSEWTMIWKQKYEKLEADYTQAKVMYLDSDAVVRYLESKINQLVKQQGE